MYDAAFRLQYVGTCLLFHLYYHRYMAEILTIRRKHYPSNHSIFTRICQKQSLRDRSMVIS